MLVVLLPLLAFSWFTAGPDARFSVDRLRGETPADVIKEFGPPQFDPRSPSDEAWTPEKEARLGPLTFDYLDKGSFRGYAYGIIFKDGKVFEVVVGHK